MKYFAYHLKDPIVIGAKTANGLILSRFECGMNITPSPKDNEECIEMDNEKAIIFPTADMGALMVRVNKE